jgi:hypothetical protein
MHRRVKKSASGPLPANEDVERIAPTQSADNNLAPNKTPGMK